MTAYTTKDITVDGGPLRVGIWGDGGPLVVAAHGITGSHMSWAAVGPELGRDHRFVAPDLRGRGASRDLPGPYGMAAHAADLAVVLDAFGGPAILVGHSMGGFVVVETARRYPDLVRRLVLVDGGAPLPLPAGIDASAGDDEMGARLAEALGPSYARLSMTFPSREAYRDMWRAHPSLVDWTDVIEAYCDYDLVGTEPELRPACRLETALRDSRDLYALPGVEPGPLPVPAAFLRAERGMMDEPDKPFYRPGYASRWFPGLVESTVDGTNHYTIVLGPAGVAAVAAAVRG
jgi:pimeloyl-ACP methyl ester carboxylesterase